MRLTPSAFFFGSLLAFAMGCSSDEDGSPGSGGSPNMTGGTPSASGGTTGSGGASGGGFGTGGVEATGGATGGASATGGTPDGDGGSATGGENATGGGDGTGGGGGSNQAQPSAGCGMSTMGDGNVNDAIVSFPSGYDGSTPMPLIFAFHGAGRSNEQFRTVDARTQGHALEADYIVVYLKSDGNDWLAGSNAGKFDAALGTMLSNNCVDENRLFAIGHSSGAQFITTLLCGGENRFLGTAPVAGGIIGQCNDHPQVHQLYIHGKMDTQRGNGNGAEAADLVIGVNMCGDPAPYEQTGCDSGGTAVDPGCNEYQNCDKRMVWCSHNDPNYSNTNHGWPCFANDAIKTFFDSL